MSQQTVVAWSNVQGALEQSRQLPSFGDCLRALRQRLAGKQLWLARVAGCSDAAVSFWETGKRLPALSTLSRIENALTEAGASPGDLAGLRLSWFEARLESRSDPRLLRA
jgi:transcriptional regulator with XRE-family HTH domain